MRSKPETSPRGARPGGVKGLSTTAAVVLLTFASCGWLATMPDRQATVAFESFAAEGATREALFEALDRAGSRFLCNADAGPAASADKPARGAAALPAGAWRELSFHCLGAGCEVIGYEGAEEPAFKQRFQDKPSALAALRERQAKLQAIRAVKMTFLGPTYHRVSFDVSFGPDGRVVGRKDPYGWD